MSQLVLGILHGFLGKHKMHNSDSGQISFDCPCCAENRGRNNSVGKGNLEVNYKKGIFKCWACYETYDMGGSISKLIRKYGTKNDYQEYIILNPTYKYNQDGEEVEEEEIIEYPEGFTFLDGCDPSTYRYNQVMEYLTKRNITSDLIKKYNIGFTTIGKYANRIIIPSYDKNGNLNYFVGRSFVSWVKQKYKNPKSKKETIIFNENKINWESTIYLTEGVFDGMVTPNTVILLGKVLSDEMFHTLQTKAKGLVVIALDGDAYDDAILIYKKLNTLNLYNRVRIIRLRDDLDLSLINQKWKRKAVVNVLKTAHQIHESKY